MLLIAIPSVVGLCGGGNYSGEDEGSSVHRGDYGVQRKATSLLKAFLEHRE